MAFTDYKVVVNRKGMCQPSEEGHQLPKNKATVGFICARASPVAVT